MVKEYRMSKARLTFLNNSKQPYPAWSMSLLKDAVEINPKTESLPNQFVYIDLEAVQRGTLISTKIYKKQDAPSRAQRLLKANDVLFQMVRPYQKNNYFFKLEGSLPTVSSTGYAQLRAKNNCQKFIYYTLHTEKFVRNVLDRCTGGTYPAINSSDLGEIVINIPCKEEQQKIAAFFTALDEKIRLSEQKLNLISKIKKGIAQKLFAQDLRFKNKDGYFFDSWKSYTVGELVDVIGGGTPSTQNPDYWDGDIYWLTPTEINSKYVHSSNRKITFDGVRNSSAKLLPKGALLLTTRATLGACSINNQDNPVCTNQGFQSLVCKDGVDNEFMYYVVTDSAFQKTMIQRASGSTFLEISSKNLKGIVIHLPSLEEQRQIATLLSSLDKKIDCLKQRVKALKTQKASFMQQMFV